MSYIVFARKYRPQGFDEVIGQSHITTTLKNAITQNRVAHAYIFAGPRGVGKTTTARIFAKALNCEKGPTENPCGKCPSCAEITQGTSLDILEIDGASNRGIDEIRNLRENVKFAPSKGRFKVYIIDEVHMLTAEAFNALLKTLEEPPAHVKFIFATTQAHKVPPTILSRCQRFDFRRISIKDIVGSLKSIVKKEGLKVDDDVLMLIARHSDGSMRDAQVVLDQISSFAEGKISAQDASKILGAVSDDILFALAESIKSRDAAFALKTIDSLADEGKDIVQVVLYLIEHFRNLSMIKVSKDPSSLVDASAEKIALYEEQARKFTVEEILYIIYTLSGTLDFIRKSGMPRAPLEMAFIKLTLSGSVKSYADILERLEKIESAASRNCAEPPEALSGRPTDLRSGRIGDRPGGEEAASPAIASPAIRRDEAISKNAQLGEVSALWNAVLNNVKNVKISVAMYLKEGAPQSFEADTLSISFPRSSQFHKEMLESPENKSLILKAIKETLGRELRLKFVISENNGNSDNAQKGAFEDSLEDDSIIKDIPGRKGAEDPIINDALEIFGGEIENNKNKNGQRKD